MNISVSFQSYQVIQIVRLIVNTESIIVAFRAIRDYCEMVPQTRAGIFNMCYFDAIIIPLYRC